MERYNNSFGYMASQILVVDDSQIILTSFTRVLEEAGYVVDTAPNGRYALQKLGSWEPQLCLVDLIMPEMDGYQTIRNIRERFPGMKIIAISSQPESLARQEMIRLGADDYMQKPIVKDVLIKAIETQILEREILIKSQADIPDEIVTHAKNQPYDVHIKKCYICGYDQVRVFVPKAEAIIEDWNAGFYPEYDPAPGFQQWDFLRNLVSICPSCLFASSDPNDFSKKVIHSVFPYQQDAKKVLGQGIAARKRMVEKEHNEMVHNFDKASRTHDETIITLQIAEKCANGLAQGNKKGVYAQIGLVRLYIGVLDRKRLQEMAALALKNFKDQLKDPNNSRAMIARCYYFIIILHMVLSESLKANEEKTNLEKYYASLPEDHIVTAEERQWNQRLFNIWRDGIDPSMPREIEN